MRDETAHARLSLWCFYLKSIREPNTAEDCQSQKAMVGQMDQRASDLAAKPLQYVCRSSLRLTASEVVLDSAMPNAKIFLQSPALFIPAEKSNWQL